MALRTPQRARRRRALSMKLGSAATWQVRSIHRTARASPALRPVFRPRSPEVCEPLAPIAGLSMRPSMRRRSRSAMVRLVVTVERQIEAEHAAVSVIFDRLWEAGVVPCLPELGKGPMVDVDRDRSRSFKIDADQADDRAKVDHAIDSHLYWLHHISICCWGEKGGVARRTHDAMTP